MNSMVLATDRFVNKSSWTGISSRKYLHANSLSNRKSADKSTQGHYVNDHARMIHCVPLTSAKGTRCKIIKSRCKGGKGLCALNSSPSFGRNPQDSDHFPSLFKLLQTIFFEEALGETRTASDEKGFYFTFTFISFVIFSDWQWRKPKPPKYMEISTLTTDNTEVWNLLMLN